MAVREIVLYADTVRPHCLKVIGLDAWGKQFSRTFEEFDAALVHHEIDHLDGVLFIDRVESQEDFYTIRLDGDGHAARVPIPWFHMQNLTESYGHL